jgi:hypothetical protein
MRARAVGYGPTLAGSGRCAEYIDPAVCEADLSCNWRRGHTTKTGKKVADKCAVKAYSKVMHREGSQAQKDAAAANGWIARVKAYAAANGVSYKDAMKALKGTGGAKGQRGGYRF